MKFALSVVAIAAIATIYSTGAFVSQTPGLDNTVEGFLAISDAEMAQQVGGQHVQPREGLQKYVAGDPVPDENAYCVKDNGCARGKKNKRKDLNRHYYECEPCIPPVYYNECNHVSIWPKHSRMQPNGTHYWVPAKFRVSCHKNPDGECKLHTSILSSGDQVNSCERPVGQCL